MACASVLVGFFLAEATSTNPEKPLETKQNSEA
jgi:hypothetical protein